MVERVVVLVGQGGALGAGAWRSAVKGVRRIEVAQAWPTGTDAGLVSAYRCEPYGNRSGSGDDTLGVMYVYDTWQFEEPNPTYPRLLIANAIWRSEPPLEEAIARRIEILAKTITDYNEGAAQPIRSVTIDSAVLGVWKERSAAEQKRAAGQVAGLIDRLL